MSMGNIIPFLWGLVPSIITAMAVFYLQRAQKNKDSRMDAHENAIAQRDALALELQIATAKLTFAVAMAVKRGKPNGEIEEGVEAYKIAKERYNKFIREQAAEHLNLKEA